MYIGRLHSRLIGIVKSSKITLLKLDKVICILDNINFCLYDISGVLAPPLEKIPKYPYINPLAEIKYSRVAHF